MSSPEKPAVAHRPIWFPSKRYGWGWGPPVVWQGWVVLIAYVLGMAADGFFLAGRHWIAYYAIVAIASAALIGICYLRGERPRWRWGK